ncbi:9616_t:CDS:2 [Racocetra persica]|uniref:9616_t:CDS:1 n=1 Tax=Racocetra persica TaxID=160502 RepID=A0ACA9MBQ1_9GLOM|nr:9616_t:CDS:2 [Racocetra persica]
MSVNHKTLDEEYEGLFKTGVRAYNNKDYKTSYSSKHYENNLGISENYSAAFDLYTQVSNSDSKYKYNAKIWLALYFDNKNDYQKAFEFYFDIYRSKLQKISEIKLLLAEHVERGLDDFKDNYKAFEFYYDLYKNVPEYKSFARNHLIKCYKDGIGVKKDEEKVYKLENKALNYENNINKYSS